MSKFDELMYRAGDTISALAEGRPVRIESEPGCLLLDDDGSLYKCNVGGSTPVVGCLMKLRCECGKVTLYSVDRGIGNDIYDEFGCLTQRCSNDCDMMNWVVVEVCNQSAVVIDEEGGIDE